MSQSSLKQALKSSLGLDTVYSIIVLVCESKPMLPFATAEVCSTEVSIEYKDIECYCQTYYRATNIWKFLRVPFLFSILFHC